MQALLAEQDRKYQAWLGQAQPLLEAHRFKEAFSTYPFISFPSIPFVPLVKPLEECRMALSSSAGIWLVGQEPFDASNVVGDSSVREIPLPLDRSRVRIGHDHYDHRYAEEDLNTVFPVDRLRELAEEGMIGAFLSPVYSFTGYCPDVGAIGRQSAPGIASAMAAAGADAAVIVAV